MTFLRCCIMVYIFLFLFLTRNLTVGAGEMAKQLRQLAVLPREPRFDCQHPRGGLQPSVTPISGHMTSFSGPLWHQACMWYMVYRHAFRPAICTHKWDFKKKQSSFVAYLCYACSLLHCLPLRCFSGEMALSILILRNFRVCFFPVSCVS